MAEEPNFLYKQAERCRQVAKNAADPRMRKTLLHMARDYEDRAIALKAEQKLEERKPG